MQPPTPFNRKRREDMRRQALDFLEKGVNRRGGPVDKGPPEEQRRAAEKLQGAKREERNDRVKASLGRPQINRQVGNPRFGQRYRTVLRPGGAVHDYAGRTRDVFVKRKPESGGTGNHPGSTDAKRTTGNVLKPVERAHKPAPSTYDTMARDLATRRATQNRPNAKRKLFAAARTASYGRVDSNRPSRMPSVDQLRRRAQRLQRSRGRSYS